MEATREILISFIQTNQPPVNDVYMVQKKHPFWSKYGCMIYGIGDLWKWTCDFNKLSISELEEIVNKLNR
jgi:hypothetical protein